MAPVFEDVSKEYGGKLDFGKIHTVDYPNAAEEHKIEGIPCLVMFQGGREKGRIVGYMSKEQLKGKIDSLLAK
jgi:thiol-disulfide isomerase/thioredoxin